MKVKDLIEELNKFPQDLEVVGQWEDIEYGLDIGGEVAELVVWLRYNADYALQKAATATFKRFHRAADLLERLAQPESQRKDCPGCEGTPEPTWMPYNSLIHTKELL